MSIERVVAVLTPIFGAASAWLTGLVAANFPGLPAIPAGDVTALEIAGFTGASAAALKWLHGRQKFTEVTDDATKARAELAKLQAEIAANPTAGPALADIEALLKSHEGQLEQTIDAHVPTAVGKALQTLFAQLSGTPTPASANRPAAAAAPEVTGP